MKHIERELGLQRKPN